MSLNCIYFSATDTTRRYVRAMVKAMGIKKRYAVNLADNAHTPIPGFSEEDVVIVAAPVYGGRLPAIIVEALNRMSGGGARAVAMVVYGNRDYDDALLELTDILSEHGFTTVGAGAFIGQHSIFPKVGAGRPDKSDLEQVQAFATGCLEAIESGRNPELTPKGHRPYRKASGAGLSPRGSEEMCSQCGFCVERCPTGAISAESPWLTDRSKCIACGRCIRECSEKTRRHSGWKYRMVGTLFATAFSRRREPEFIVG